MDDLNRILPPNCTKVFVHRDFTDGTAVKFQTKFPAELEGKVRLVASTTIVAPHLLSYLLMINFKGLNLLFVVLQMCEDKGSMH